MIGIIARPSERAVITEFFELFKTPWEFYRNAGSYDVLLCSSAEDLGSASAPLTIVYSGKRIPLDPGPAKESSFDKTPIVLSYKENRLPLYGEHVTFDGGIDLLFDREPELPVIYQRGATGKVLVRIGYNLFEEIATLLTSGQPACFANIPTLDLHIELLRELIVTNGIPLLEIPPAPDGHPCIACLTHDVDHPVLRRHRWDHTTLGFLFRSLFRSPIDYIQGKTPVHDLVANWRAALQLPLVLIGLTKDTWAGFVRQYKRIEKEIPSTFFIIPFANRAGLESSGKSAPAMRGAGYGAADIEPIVAEIVTSGSEVGLHGIDAWVESTRGSEEFEEIRKLTGEKEIGVRMHWLYFDQSSPETLEQAKAAYDSTVGYRETIGFRVGTAQAYKPLRASQLLELALHAMDTALFYPVYLGLSAREASKRLQEIVEQVVLRGGCFTVNWHDRSLAPERLWYRCYEELLQMLKRHGVWFATLGQANRWFKKRRAVSFNRDERTGSVRVSGFEKDEAPMPALRLRRHSFHAGSWEWTDTTLTGDLTIPMPCISSAQ